MREPSPRLKPIDHEFDHRPPDHGFAASWVAVPEGTGVRLIDDDDPLRFAWKVYPYADSFWGVRVIEIQAKLILGEAPRNTEGSEISGGSGGTSGGGGQSIRVVLSTAMVEQYDFEVVWSQHPADGEPAAYELLERFIRQAFDTKEDERRDIESAYL